MSPRRGLGRRSSLSDWRRLSSWSLSLASGVRWLPLPGWRCSRSWCSPWLLPYVRPFLSLRQDHGDPGQLADDLLPTARHNIHLGRRRSHLHLEARRKPRHPPRRHRRHRPPGVARLGLCRPCFGHSRPLGESSVSHRGLQRLRRPSLQIRPVQGHCRGCGPGEGDCRQGPGHRCVCHVYGVRLSLCEGVVDISDMASPGSSTSSSLSSAASRPTNETVCRGQFMSCSLSTDPHKERRECTINWAHIRHSHHKESVFLSIRCTCSRLRGPCLPNHRRHSPPRRRLAQNDSHKMIPNVAFRSLNVSPGTIEVMLIDGHNNRACVSIPDLLNFVSHMSFFFFSACGGPQICPRVSPGRAKGDPYVPSPFPPMSQVKVTPFLARLYLLPAYINTKSTSLACHSAGVLQQWVTGRW